MLIPLVVPDFRGEGTHARLCAWLRRPGDHVAAGEAVAELATEKSVLELAAPAAGVLQAPLTAAGEAVAVGTVVGALVTALITDSPADAALPAAPPMPPAQDATPGVARGISAATHGVALRADAPATGMRRAIAQRVGERLAAVPHVTAVIEVDADAVMADRAARGAAAPGITAYALRALAAACRAVPEVNAAWTGDRLRWHPRLAPGVVVDLDGNGLVIAVIPLDAADDVAAIDAALRTQVAAARAGRLDGAAQRGATLTVSNHGMQGTLLAAPVVIGPDQVAALGLGAVRRVPVVAADGSLAVGWRGLATLTIDHRALDGHHAGAWLRAFAAAWR